MRKPLLTFSLALLAGLATPAFADEPATKPAAHYSVTSTKNAVLIDDPAAAAILKQLIPTIWENSMFQSAGRELTLKDVQQFEQVLTDEKLAEIQAALDKIPARQ